MNKVRNTLLASGKQVPVTTLCKWLGLPRSSAYYLPRQRCERALDQAMAACIRRIHRQEPACGVRGTWSRLRFVEGLQVNRKKVHRIMKLKGWTLPKRRAGRRSIVHARVALRAWIHHYNHQRPHQALNFKSPNQYHQSRCNTAA